MSDINKSMNKIAEAVVSELDSLLRNKYGQNLTPDERIELKDAIYVIAIQRGTEENTLFAARVRNSSMHAAVGSSTSQDQNRIDQILDRVAERCNIPFLDLTSMKTDMFNVSDSIAGAVNEALRTLGFTWRPQTGRNSERSR